MCVNLSNRWTSTRSSPRASAFTAASPARPLLYNVDVCVYMHIYIYIYTCTLILIIIMLMVILYIMVCRICVISVCRVLVCNILASKGPPAGPPAPHLERLVQSDNVISDTRMNYIYIYIYIYIHIYIMSYHIV